MYLVGTNILFSDYLWAARFWVAANAESIYCVPDEDGDGQTIHYMKTHA